MKRGGVLLLGEARGLGERLPAEAVRAGGEDLPDGETLAAAGVVVIGGGAGAAR